jgi:hypothetical protein
VKINISRIHGANDAATRTASLLSGWMLRALRLMWSTHSCKEMRLQQSAASEFRDDHSMVVLRFFMTMDGGRVSAAEI